MAGFLHDLRETGAEMRWEYFAKTGITRSMALVQKGIKNGVVSARHTTGHKRLASLSKQV
jgi:hypothetical protein